MKRRQFISNSLLTTGGVLIGTNILHADALKEINQQFSNDQKTDSYDIIINGAGLAGYYAAIEASKRGMKVLILDKRTSPGYDIAAKSKLWIDRKGFESFRKDHFELFFPKAEISELSEMYANAEKNMDYSLFKDELLLFSGSIKKGLLRNLLLNKVHVMLMTDVCGILSDKTTVSGVLVANKHGLYTINCKNYFDATENNLFTREFFNQKFTVNKAGFVIQLTDVVNPETKVISVAESFGVLNNSMVLHKGKRSADQQFLEFEFNVTENDHSAIEQKARFISSEISKNISTIDPSFIKAKLSNYALDCSYYIDNNNLSKPLLNGYYCCNSTTVKMLNCQTILETELSAKLLVDQIKLTFEKKSKRVVQFMGGEEIYSIKESGEYVNESGLILPLSPFKVEDNMNLPTDNCQVFVAGGGTAGAFAAVGAAEKGAEIILAEYFNDMGGTKTMGGVLGYYYGLSTHAYVKDIERRISEVKQKYNMTGGIERRFHILKTINELGVRVISGAIFCGAITNNRKLSSVIICVNGKLSKIKSDITIDSTGDADIAYFAGVNFRHGNSRTGITQNYSQWDIPAKENMPSNHNRDYDIIDNTKVSELQRGLFLSHYESHFYDLYPMLTVRESRQPEGLYTLNIKDVINKTHFEDFIARSWSDFDPHYIGSSEYSRCGFLLPHTNTSTVEIPLRSIIPKSIDGLLFSGRGISQTTNAMQFTRMSADVTTLGYVTGQIASEMALNKLLPRDYNISTLQAELIKQDFLPVVQPQQTESPQEKVSKLIAGDISYLFKCCLLPKESVLPFLSSEYKKSKNLQIAKALAWFSNSDGIDEIIKELDELYADELEFLKTAAFVDKYDPENLYWKINQNIGLLALSGDKKCFGIILKILNATTSGGKTITYLQDNLYNSNRIDLRLIPFHNRITNLCFFIERLPDLAFISGLDKLLEDKSIGRFKTTEYHETRWRVYGADLELYIGSALARCGSRTGLELLVSYLDEIHSNFREFALKELKSITGTDHGFDKVKWEKYFSERLVEQGKTVGLIKEVEL